VVEQTFQKDLSHLTWDEVYARQMQRAELVAEWMDALQLAAGGRVLEVGSGPGYVSLRLAERVGSVGVVYAVDRSAEALAYLERVQNERGVQQIRRLAADAAALDAAAVRADAALVSMVLHHADDPAGILRNLYRLLPEDALAVVAEFHPAGPCEQGAPRASRLAPEQVEAWCESAGLSVLRCRRQTPEHYFVVARRASRAPRSAQ
jgi:ubiquinone/menaquinone biosynthesis C-methylase UbiE